MLFKDQADELRDASDLVDNLLTDVDSDWEDPNISDITISLEDARKICEAFEFLYNASAELGLFRNLRDRPRRA